MLKKLRGRVAANRANRQFNRSQRRTQREREKLDNTVYSRGSRTTPNAPDATARRGRSYSLYYKGDGARKDQFTTEESGNTRTRSEEHTSELQSRPQLVCRLLHEKKRVRLLLGSVAYPGTRTGVTTPLENAIYVGNTQFVELLAEHDIVPQALCTYASCGLLDLFR